MQVQFIKPDNADYVEVHFGEKIEKMPVTAQLVQVRQPDYLIIQANNGSVIHQLVIRISDVVVPAHTNKEELVTALNQLFTSN